MDSTYDSCFMIGWVDNISTPHRVSPPDRGSLSHDTPVTTNTIAIKIVCLLMVSNRRAVSLELREISGLGRPIESVTRAEPPQDLTSPSEVVFKFEGRCSSSRE